MDLSESTKAILSFVQSNTPLAVALAVIALFFMYRRPKAFFGILCLGLFLAGLFYLIMSLAGPGSDRKKRLIEESTHSHLNNRLHGLHLWILSLLILPLIFGLSGCALTNTSQGLSRERPEIPGKQKETLPNKREDGSKKTSPTEAAEHKKMGDQYLSEGNPDLAFIQYSKSLQLDPNQPQVRYEMGRLFLRKELYGEAREKFQEVLEAIPRHAMAYDGIGRTCFFTGQYTEAEDHFRKALSLDSVLWEAHNFLGIIYDYRKEFDRAAHEYRTAIGIKPDVAMLFNNLGMSLLGKGDHEDAVRAFNEAIKFGNVSRKVHNNLALALGKLGRYQEALDAFKKGGDTASAYYNLGRVHLMEGEYQQAIKAFEEAIDARPAYYLEAHKSLESAKAGVAAAVPAAETVIKPAVNSPADAQRNDLIATAQRFERPPAENPAPVVEEKRQDTDPGTLDSASGSVKETTLEAVSLEQTGNDGPSMAETENPQQPQASPFVEAHTFSPALSSALEELLSHEPDPDPPQAETLALSSPPEPGNPSEGSPEPTITVESNDDFDPETARVEHGEPLPDEKVSVPEGRAVRLTGAEPQNPDRNGTKLKEILHTIKKGDSLWSIARKYNVSVSAIKSWNNLNGTSRLRPFDRLKLIVKSSTLN